MNNRNVCLITILAVLALLSGCFEGGQVGTGGDFNQTTLSGRATIADVALPNADVALSISGEQYSAQTDAAGNYSIELSTSDAQENDIVKLEVTAVSSDVGFSTFAVGNQSLQLVSIPGTLSQLKALAGNSDVVTLADVPRLEVNAISSAEYGLIFDANSRQTITNEQTLQALKSNISLAQQYALSALIELAVTDDSYTLPNNISTILTIIENYGLAATEIARYEQSNATRVADQVNSIAGRELLVDCNLFVSGADLRGCDFTDQEVSDADLSMADFSYSRLSGAQFSHANFRSASFAYTNALNAVFSFTDISSANFQNTVLVESLFEELTSNDVNFRAANLTRSNFQFTSFERADFTGAQLSSSVFNQSTFSNADFSGAMLAGASMTFVSLDGANFSGANLTGARFDNVTAVGALWENTICPDGSLAVGECELTVESSAAPDCTSLLPGANLRGCNLSFSNLNSFDLQGADLRNANLRGAAMLQTNFGGAQLSNAMLEYGALQSANLTGADLSGANLRAASVAQADLSNANLTDAITADMVIDDAIWQDTTCPDGTVSSQPCAVLP